MRDPDTYYHLTVIVCGSSNSIDLISTVYLQALPVFFQWNKKQTTDKKNSYDHSYCTDV